MKIVQYYTLYSTVDKKQTNIINIELKLRYSIHIFSTVDNKIRVIYKVTINDDEYVCRKNIPHTSKTSIIPVTVPIKPINGHNATSA